MKIYRNTKSKITLLLLTVTIAALLTVSCATKPGAFQEMDFAVEQSNFSGAVEALRRAQEERPVLYNERNAISLFLDKGLLEHYAGNYLESSEDLQNAERLIEEAYTKSVTQNFMSYIINDNTREYPGEDFEDIYLNVFNALNYFNRGSLEGALVEIRKLSMSSGKLDTLALRHEHNDPETGSSMSDTARKQTGVTQMPDAVASNFSNSALARFLGALFFQAARNTDSARIEFSQIPRAFSANREVFKHPIPRAVDEAQNVPAGKARLHILSFTGLSPIKEEQKILHNLPFRHPVLSVAQFKLPVMVKRPSQITRIETVVDGVGRFDLELLEDMGAVIEETFKNRYNKIVLKTYIRTIIKYAVADVAARTAARQTNEFAGLMVAIAARGAMDASESADIRMSRYLPDKAHVGGINLDPGTYSVIINYYNESNIIIASEHRNITVTSGGLNLIQSVNLK
ncbi:MAG: hypothetical protein FWD26_06070 [Treponema sp.]|nr:hypothetical protein [Treponema sp.]